MTLLTSWPLRLDGLIIGTYAHGLREVRGIHQMAPSRLNPVVIDNHPGAIAEWDAYRNSVVRRYSIWVAGTTADGTITHPSGERGHLEENLKALFLIVAKRGTPIAFEQDVPLLAGGTEILSGNCAHADALEVGDSRGLRDLDLRLWFPYPYLHAGSLVTAAGLSGSFTRDTSPSTAAIQDMKLTFKTGTNPRLTVNEGAYTGQYLEWIGSPGASGVEIDVATKRVRQLPGGTDAIGGLRRSHRDWMTWPAGDSALSMTLTGGGTIDLAYHQARA